MLGIGGSLFADSTLGLAAAALVAIVVTAAIILDWRRGVFLLVATLPFEPVVGASFPLLVKAAGVVTLVAVLGALVRTNALEERLTFALHARPTLWLGAFCLLGSISAAWALSPRAAMVAAATASSLLLFMVMVALLQRRDVYSLLKWFVAVAVASVPVALWIGQDRLTERFASGGSDPNDYAALLLLGVMVCGYGLTGSWRYVAATILVAGILGTASRGGFVALVTVPALLMLVPGRSPDKNNTAVRRFARLAIVVAVILGTVWLSFSVLPRVAAIFSERAETLSVVKAQTFSGRTIIWNTGLRLYEEHPVLGVGLGNFALANDSGAYAGAVAHNMYLGILAELGVIGLLMFVGFLVSLLRSSLRVARLDRMGTALLGSLFVWMVMGSDLSLELRKPFYLIAGCVLALLHEVGAPESAATARLPE